MKNESRSMLPNHRISGSSLGQLLAGGAATLLQLLTLGSEAQQLVLTWGCRVEHATSVLQVLRLDEVFQHFERIWRDADSKLLLLLKRGLVGVEVCVFRGSLTVRLRILRRVAWLRRGHYVATVLCCAAFSAILLI